MQNHEKSAGQEATHLGLGEIVSCMLSPNDLKSDAGCSDKEIESVNGRLASLERMLETVLASNRTESSSSNASSSASSAPTLSTPRDQLAWRELDFEGDSSFRAQVRSVTQVMEKGLKSGSDVDAETIGGVTAAVATLRNFLNEKPGSPDTAAPLQDTLQDVVDYPELSLLTLPSMQTVLSLLRYAKSERSSVPESPKLPSSSIG